MNGKVRSGGHLYDAATNASTPRTLGAVVIGSLALAGVVWAAQSNTVAARMCALRSDSCQQQQVENEAINARLLTERRALEAAHARALEDANRRWEGRIAAVQTEWARTEEVERQDRERQIAAQIDALVTGAGLPGGADAPPGFYELHEYLTAARTDQEQLGGALAEIDVLRRENGRLSEQLWDVRAERDVARDSLERLDRALEVERVRRRDSQFRDFQARATWAICADLSRHAREVCADAVRARIEATHRRFTDCIAYTDAVPELTNRESSYASPSYWVQVWSDDSEAWWVGLCDARLPEAAGP